MLSKLKSIANKTIRKTKELELSNKTTKLYGYMNNFSRFFVKFVEKTADFCVKFQISANFVTIFGFVIGILAMNFISLEKYSYALICILVNRFCDALDGAVARRCGESSFGIFLDATLDYIFYAGVIFGFALANPGQNAIPAAFLLFAFAAAACSMLAYAVISYKNNDAVKADITSSPFYLGGLAQGCETLVALVVLCLIPGFFVEIAILLGILTMIKVLSTMAAAYYNFAIVYKNPKK